MARSCVLSDACGRCPFACTCFSCKQGHGCHCSCRFVILLQLIVIIIAGLVALVAIRERRKFLVIWSSIYALSSVMMLFVTYARGASPHDIFFSCSSPFLVWCTLLFVSSLSCYTSEFMLADDSSLADRFVYDPMVRRWIPVPHTPRGVHAAAQ